MSPRRGAHDRNRPLWRPPGPDRRVRVLHLFVEGAVTEKSYADRINEHFAQERQRLRLRVEGNGHPRELVDAATQMRQQDVADYEDLSDPRQEPEVWCLFDCDEHAEVDAAIAKAIRNGVQVAFSHPCFELWLLLHFQQYAVSLGGRCGDLESRLRQHHGFEFYEKNVGRAQWAALSGRFGDARTRALQLIGRCPSGGCGPEEHAPHCVPTQRDPSTDMWRLLDSLPLRY